MVPCVPSARRAEAFDLLRGITFANNAVEARCGLLAWIAAMFGKIPYMRKLTFRDRCEAGAAASLLMIRDADHERLELLERHLAELALLVTALVGRVEVLERHVERAIAPLATTEGEHAS